MLLGNEVRSIRLAAAGAKRPLPSRQPLSVALGANQFMLRMEQAPGPRGSPQDPQAPEAGADEELPLAATAKTESWGSSFLVWHLGHSAFSLP
jgi:hypothetical protein